MNKVLIIAIAVVSISISAQIGFAAPTIGVEPSYQSVSYGDTFKVNITVDPDGSAIAGVEHILCFNNTLLNATLLTSGEFFSGFDVDTYGERINNIAGTVDYCELMKPPITEGIITPGTFTTITFHVIGEHGLSDLYFKKVTLSDPDGYRIQNVAYSGRVGVAQAPIPFMITGYVSYGNGSDCSDPAVNITNMDICEDWTADRNETSNYYQITLASPDDVIAGEILRFDVASPDGSMSNTTEHIVTQDELDAGGFGHNIMLEYRLGDVNGDGKITSADAVIALQMAVRGDYSEIADVSDDNSVTSLDVLMILQVAAANITVGR